MSALAHFSMSIYTFGRYFRRYTGISPSDYRAMTSKKEWSSGLLHNKNQACLILSEIICNQTSLFLYCYSFMQGRHSDWSIHRIYANRFRHHRLLWAGGLSQIFDSLWLIIPLDFFAVLFIVFWCKFGGNLPVEGGKVGLHLFFEYFLVVLEKLFEDVVDEVPDAAGRPVSWT